MDIYNRKQRWKFLLFLIAAIIGISSLLYTNRLVKVLAEEERKKVELLAVATRQLLDDNVFDLLLPMEVSISNTTIPVMTVDQDDNILAHRNLDSLRAENPAYLQRQFEKMKEKNPPISYEITDSLTINFYYRNFTLLTKLTYYPYIQLGVILLFILVSYLAFSASRKAEQNQVWVGLSKKRLISLEHLLPPYCAG